MAGLKMHLAFAPMGKDLTEAWQAGCDIAAFVRGIVRDPGYAFTPPAWSHAEYTPVCGHVGLVDVLGGLKDQTVYLCLSAERGVFALASDTAVWAGTMQDAELSSDDLSGLNIVCEDPVETRAAFQSTVSLLDFDSVLYLAAELDGKPQSLDDLEIKYFGGAVPEQPVDDSPDKWIQNAADRCTMLRKVYGCLKAKVGALPAPDRERLLRCYAMRKDTQEAFAQMRRHGLHIDVPLAKAMLASRKNDLAMQYGADVPQKERVRTTNLQKLIAAADDHGDVHALYSLYGTATGRISCSKPNLQGIDGHFKKLVQARPGRKLVVADYARAEFRIASILAEDTALAAFFADGGDIHDRTSREIAGSDAGGKAADRRWGKTVNFGFLYGQGARGLQHSLNEKYGIVLSIEQCKALQARFRKSYPILDAWGSSVRAAANTVDTACTAFPRTGVHTATGRWVPIIPFGRSGYTCPVNYTVQGTGADIMLLVLGKLPKLLVGLDAVIVNCVHDEVLVEASEADAEKAAEALAEAMTEAFTAVFPTADARNLVDVHIADAWAEAK